MTRTVTRTLLGGRRGPGPEAGRGRQAMKAEGRVVHLGGAIDFFLDAVEWDVDGGAYGGV